MQLRGSKRLLRASLVCLALVLVGAVAIGQQRIRGFMRDFGPRSDLLVSRPEILWEVWPEQGQSLTKVEIKLNGEAIDARYDAQARSIRFHPQTPLAIGEHRVEARAMVNDFLELKKDWTFRVLPEAVATLPEPSSAQLNAVETTNQIRVDMKLPPVRSDLRLHAASAAHAQYLAVNGETGHLQVPGKSGFLARTPKERLALFGYVSMFYEVEGEGGVQAIFDAPYHRIPFMQPGSPSLGAGVGGSTSTLLIGSSRSVGIVCSPADGAENVPDSWSGIETPNPLRMHGHTGTTGYPIVLSAFGEDSKLVVQSADLEDEDGKPVLFYLNTPENDDELKHAALLIPRNAYKRGTKYRYRFQIQKADGTVSTHSGEFRVKR
jgi:hypothetical protein